MAFKRMFNLTPEVHFLRNLKQPTTPTGWLAPHPSLKLKKKLKIGDVQVTGNEYA
jgi:hypothetical protein